MGKIISNGVQYSGLMNVEGAFIDTNNIITSGTYQSTFSYTATEDCYISIVMVIEANNSSTITIDGELIIGEWCASLYSTNPIIPLKKGQTLVVTASSSAPADYKVYGIQSGSNVISTENNYSTNEQVVGKWIDGNDIYQKTWQLSSSITVDGNGTALPSEVTNDLTNIENIIDAKAIRVRSSNTLPAVISAYVWNTSSNNYSILSADNWTGISIITLRYTKSS